MFIINFIDHLILDLHLHKLIFLAKQNEVRF